MCKKFSIVLILVLCLVMNSVVAFAASPNDMEVSEETTMEKGAVVLANFSGTFDSNGYCTITNVPNEGGYQILFLQNVPGKNITCTITGNSNLHYELEYTHSGFPAFTYVSNRILGNGSTTSTTKLGFTGNYFVSVMPYDGTLNAKKITLTFHAW